MDGYSTAMYSGEPSSASSGSFFSPNIGSPSYDDDSGATSGTPNTVPHPRRWGRFDPEDEDNIPHLESVSDDGLRSDVTDRRKMLDSPSNDYYPLSCTTASSRPSATATCHFLSLPSELIDAILSYLSLSDLTSVGRTNHKLHTHASSDHHWHALVQSNIPGVRVETPYPCATFRELYQAHDPRWFLPKYKIWFCDWDLIGKVLVVRYDPRRGCIEGYQLLATRNEEPTYTIWPADDQVIIHTFEPRVYLHLDKPLLQLHARSLENLMMQAIRSPAGPSVTTIPLGEPIETTPTSSTAPTLPPSNRYQAEIPMLFSSTANSAAGDGMLSNLSLARPLSPKAVANRSSFSFPYGNIWPPPAIPARHRVAGANPRAQSEMDSLAATDRPRRRCEVSEQSFRIRSWHEFRPLALDERVVTYSTLDPVLYTPTPDKPWRGIWVGDYSGHGCEFLLINQPDEDPDDEGEGDAELPREAGDTDEEYEAKRRNARIYRGRLEAIKLTGDPNVPRGEYTFVADDLGEKGFVTVIQDAPFAGARVVRSKGHIAGTGYLGDKYIESQLILMSQDRLAQYWVGFGHISFFERVHIDRFLKPN